MSILNINVGVLGHVDSGKTSLAKSISTVASTASFDKNPQSQERGITIDLGFSSFIVDMPNHLKSDSSNEKLQFTLVDCPGHASLIRTIIGGSQIIDMMILVIDITKGMQTQTAECLVIGEIMCQNMVVVLNKTDLLPEMKRSQLTEKMAKKMKATLANTAFKDAPIVNIAANPGGEANSTCIPEGIELLIETLKQNVKIPNRHISSPFLFAVDHCFSIRGQGTVLTGTILQGAININDAIEIPSMQITKKVKSMQMFRSPVENASQGDRLGICVTQFDPKQLERGLVSSPGYLSSAYAVIILAKQIKYYKNSVRTKSKLHISVGYETVLAKITVFGLYKEDVKNMPIEEDFFTFDQLYRYQDELLTEKLENTEIKQETKIPLRQYILLEFEKPIIVAPQSITIGSKLDIDIHSSQCRLAFFGNIIEIIKDKNYFSTILPNLKIYKNKQKLGSIDRVKNETEIIGKNMFKKETNIKLFLGLKVTLSTGETGIIDGSFGQSGKINIRVPGGLKEATMKAIMEHSKKSDKASKTMVHANHTPQVVTFIVEFKRYIYDPEKRIIQI